MRKGEWQPRTTLLSPFDNLIIDRSRAERMFGFRYRMEIYVPPAKRRFGPYALPILLGDRFIGQIDAATDRARGRLVLNRIHLERGNSIDAHSRRQVARAIEDLATFSGASDVDLRGPLPDGWRRAFG